MHDEEVIMKNRWKVWVMRVVLMALIIFWMTVIFGFSAEDGEQSQSLSDKITIKVIEIIEPDYDGLSTAEQTVLFDKVSFAVRKTGHFGEYGILGVLIGCFLITFEKIRQYRKGKLLVLVISTGICMLYAITDEFHQGFVDGRSPKVMDVFIDTAGGLAGCIFLIFIWLIISPRRKNEFVGEKH